MKVQDLVQFSKHGIRGLKGWVRQLDDERGMALVKWMDGKEPQWVRKDELVVLDHRKECLTNREMARLLIESIHIAEIVQGPHVIEVLPDGTKVFGIKVKSAMGDGKDPWYILADTLLVPWINNDTVSQNNWRGYLSLDQEGYEKLMKELLTLEQNECRIE